MMPRTIRRAVAVTSARHTVPSLATLCSFLVLACTVVSCDGPSATPEGSATTQSAAIQERAPAPEGPHAGGPVGPPRSEVPRRPAVADPTDWCGGHGVPESMCTVCNPELVAGYQASGDWCAEHGYPESVCPLCNPMAPPGGSAAAAAIPPGTRVRLADPSIEQAAGIETVAATVVDLGHAIDVTARIDFDRNAMADVRASVPGVVREVSVDLGDRVSAGDPLFTMESAHVGDLRARRGSANQRVQAARANLARQQELRSSAIAPERDVELARQELEAAEAELQSLEDSLRISGAARSGEAGRFVVRAPLDGEVVRRPALVGAYASEADSLATIVDTSTMWVLVAIRDWDAAVVGAGQPVVVRVDGLPGRALEGALTWVSPEVDPSTRTVAGRAEVANPEGLLRAGQFGRATIEIEAPADAVVVPAGALQRVGDQSVVFVRVGDGDYEPRVVEPGRSDGRVVQVVGDVAAGDRIVTTGAYLLRTELAPDAIGAGCCEVEPLAGE